MTRFNRKASAILLMGLAIISCKESKLKITSKPQVITSNLISDVKIKTGVDLPKSCLFIISTNYARLDSDILLFEIESNMPAQFPKRLYLLPQVDALQMAKYIERLGGISIGAPKEWYSGTWQISNVQCSATLVTASNGEYLMLELYPTRQP